MKLSTPIRRVICRPVVPGVIFALAATAVTSAYGSPQTDNAAQYAPDPMAIERGASAWAANCNRCHRMRPPGDYRDDLWDPVIYHMRIRGGLTGQETRDILLFLKQGN